MKISTKIMILITVALILSAGFMGATAIWQLNKSGEMAISNIEMLGSANLESMQIEGKTRIAKVREDALQMKKESLKSQIQTVTGVLEKAYQDAHDAKRLELVYQQQLQNAVNTAYSVLESIEKEEGISLQEKQKKAAALIKSLRYGPENKDYFWINDMHPTMVMHPFKPELDGKDLSHSKDPNGKRLFVEMVKVCEEKGEGFVDYDWPKYGADKPQPKLSFVRLFKEWDWIIGTGIYIDDIEVIVNARKALLDKELKAAREKISLQIEKQREDIRNNIKSVLWLIVGVTLLIIVLAMAGSYVFTRRSIVRPVLAITEGLNEGADQVASASGEVSASNQSLAEGSSEQAASIEETSASMEEMSSMTKQTANNSAQADSLMEDANQVIAGANRAMADLTHSMDEISKASEETSKIIKTIDEIAFQTNLLALNAAVEAARAGEAGAGFAVVADEVRNLALRAADAAKSTAAMIEGTLKRVNDGTLVVEKTNREFNKVGESATKVGELVSEISAASKEQAQGIDEVNTAVSQMDKVSQQNAATAEQSAAAAEEINAQTEQMRSYVGDLVALVTGKAGQATASRHQQAHKRTPAVKKAAFRKVKALGAKKESSRPEGVNPLDKDNFADF